MSKTNRTHTPAFKAQVALAAIKGDRTISQIAAHFHIHVNLVAHWKKQLLARSGQHLHARRQGFAAARRRQAGRTLRTDRAAPSGAGLREKKISRPRLSGSVSRSSCVTRS